jgi:hypothetical protein
MHRGRWHFLLWLLVLSAVFWAAVALRSCQPLRPTELETTR